MKNSYSAPRPSSAAALLPLPLAKRILLLCAMLVLAGFTELRAGVQYWDPDATPAGNDCTTGAGLGGAGGSWEGTLWTPDGNCTGTTAAWTEGNDAVLWGVTGAGHLYTMTLGAPHTVGSLYLYTTMSGTTIVTNYTISGSGANTLTLITGNITLDGGASPAGGSAGNLAAFLSVPIAGANGLTKLGDGILWLNAVATYSGPTIISGLLPPATGGALQMLVVNAIPSGSPVTIINGGVLNLNGRSQTVGLVVITNGYITGAGTLTAPSYEVQNCRNGNNALVASLGGTSSTFLKTTPVNVVVSGANTFGGGATISAGTITWRNNLAMGVGSVTLNDANTGTNNTALLRDGSTISASTVTLGNNIIVANQGSGNVTLGNSGYTATAQTITFSGSLTLNKSATLIAPATGNGVVFSGAISGLGGLTNIGPGLVTLNNGGNTFQGGVTFNAGILNAASGCLGTGPLTFNGGTLQFAGGFDPSTVTMTFNASGAKLDTLGNIITVANPIGNNGSGSLTKLGSGGTLVLGAADTYTGGTIVSQGTLEAQVDGSLGSGNVSVASGATVQLDTIAGIAASANLTLSGASPTVNLNYSGTCIINALSFDGGVTFTNSGTWGPVGSIAPASNQDARLTGTGLLQVTKSGSTTTLASSLNPAYYGSSVTFTAAVTVVSGTPTGTVTFKDGATVLGTRSLSAGEATLTTNNLSVTGSPHSITAAYNGDANFVPSTSAALSQVINANCSHTNAVLAITNNLNGTFKFTLAGTPGAYYYMVAQTNVAQPMANWAVVVGSTNVVTDLSGVWYFTATNPAPQYYRVAAITNCP